MANSDSDFETTDDDWSTDAEDFESERDDRESLRRAKESEMLEKVKLAEAAKEAQRQRDLFSKVPRQSYTNLPRTQSARGLLSTMFHPPPEYFPVDHPYRRSMSTHDILAQGPRAFVPLNSGDSSFEERGGGPCCGGCDGCANALSGRPGVLAEQDAEKSLRLKGRQADADLEDDSGDEDDQNKLHVSTSVAEQKLAELQQKVTTRRASMHQHHQQPAGGLAQQAQQQRQYARFNAPPESQRAGPSQYQQAPAPAAPVPITALFPYNLPAPQPPTTPRTTRRNFLAHELSESLRRNMLWEAADQPTAASSADDDGREWDWRTLMPSPMA